MRVVVPLFLVVGLALTAWAGWAIHLQGLFGVLVPYLAALIFVVGFCMKVVDWAKSAVPFKIPTTAGQQKSLPWIKHAKIESPFTTGQVILRMFFEVFFFRSLFRNVKGELRSGPSLVYGPTKWLWLSALMFHYGFLMVILHHLRLATYPVPGPIALLDKIDAMFQIGAPPIYLSSLLLLIGVVALFLRRIIIPQVRYISLVNDYFPLFLIFGIVVSGMLMRYFIRTDIVAVKALVMGLVTFHPVVPEGIGAIFYIHLFLVCCLFAYFPFSKLMHMGGVFMSPTRNLPNNNRAVRHVNPWNPKVNLHTYEEWVEDYRDKLEEAGIPTD